MMKLMRWSKTIRSLKGRESGRRAFILANGPSLLSHDLSRLKGELVIGMNASTHVEQRFGFNSDYYVVSDMRFLENEEKFECATTMLSSETIRIFRAELKAIDSQGYIDRTFYVPALERDGFSENLAVGFNYGCTTTMLALQLAYYLGVKEVYILGCDLKYPDENPRFYEEKMPQIEDSFTSVQLKNIYESSLVFKNLGGAVYNCSPVSFLRGYLPYREFGTIE
jgi:hypothetical protein